MAQRRRVGAREVLAGLAIAGLLAGIAIPLAIDEAKNRVDAQVKTDLTAVHTAIANWVLAHDEVPALTVDGTRVLLDGEEAAQIHPDTELSVLEGNTTSWCLTASNPAGKHADPPGYRYKAANEKIDTGAC